MKQATITKLSDDVFGGNHPNNINAGYTAQQYYDESDPITVPEVGRMYYFGNLRTSTVTKVLENTDQKIIFTTRNSTYQIDL